VGEEAFVEQRSEPPDLGAPDRCAENERTLVDRFLEELADRLAVDQREILLLEPQHRRAAGRVVGIERIARVPGGFALQFVADALLAQREPDLAAEWTEGEVIELPHGRSGHAASRSRRLP